MQGKVDLNLFLVLVTIYREGSITAAAQQLSLTQPAVSHALNRLREMLDDPLFQRHGRRMTPTARCHQIMPQVQHSIDTLKLSITQSWTGEPNAGSRTLNISVSPIAELILLPQLQKRLKDEYSRINLHSKATGLSQLTHQLSKGEIDLALAAGIATDNDIVHLAVHNASFFVLCRPDHPVVKRMTLSAYLTADHVLVSDRDNEHSYVDASLAREGHHRHIRTRCEYFMTAAELILCSDMLLTLPQPYVKKLTDNYPLTALPLPFVTEPLPINMYWNISTDKDPLMVNVRRWVSEIMRTEFSAALKS